MGGHLLFPLSLIQALIFNPQAAWAPDRVSEIKSVVLLRTHLGNWKRGCMWENPSRYRGMPPQDCAQGTWKGFGLSQYLHEEQHYSHNGDFCLKGELQSILSS